MKQKQNDGEQREERGRLTQAQAIEILEPAMKPFLKVVKKDQLPLIWTRERDFAVSALMRDSRFLKIDREEIVNAMKQVSFIGLSLNPVRQHCTMIASYDRTARAYVARVWVMYRGLTFLATEAGAHGIKGEVVYRDDKFRHGSSSDRGGDWYEYELNALVERDDKNFVGSFCAAKMPAGDLKVEFMPKKDVYKVRAQSDSYLDENGSPSRYSPWVKWPDEMAKKAVLRRASKHWEEMIGHSEKWERFLKVVKYDNEQDGVIRPRADDIEGQVEQKPVALLTHEQVSAITAQVRSAAFKQRICDAYGVDSLDKIPADRFDEIKQRIEAAKVEQSKKSSNKKGVDDGEQ